MTLDRLQDLMRSLGRSVDGFTASTLAPVTVFVGVGALIGSLLVFRLFHERH